jgi:hypothetical protein
VLETDGQDQLDQSCEKIISITQCQGGNEYRTYSKERKGNGIGYIWRRDFLLKYGKGGKRSGGKMRKKT